MNETFSTIKNNSFMDKGIYIEQNVLPMKPLNPISLKIQERVKQLGISQAEAARRTGLSAKNFNNYHNGREPDSSTVQQIADGLGVDWAWFFDKSSALPSDINGLSETKTPEYRGQPIEFVEIERYANKAAGGMPIESDDDIVIDGLKFRRDWLRSMTNASFSKLKLLPISGDSMEPKVCDGDLALVDTSETMPQKKGIFVIRYDGGLMAKHVTIDHLRKTITLTSENPAYKPIEIKDPEEFKIIGRLLWRGGKV